MTLRIISLRQGSRRQLAVTGRLTREEVGELEQALASDPDACLDLEDLRSVDGAGLAALRRLRAEGVEMRRVPPHLAWRIEDDEACPR
jgi:ABC-type transporter Mla MlaB component